MPLPLSAVVMASGHATRFGSDKLLAPVAGVPMVQRLFQALPRDCFQTVAVVARSPVILDLARASGLTPVCNDDRENDTAKTIRLGLTHIPPESAGCMFLVGDQPWLSTETIRDLCRRFQARPDRIHLPVHGTQRGNPVVFPAALFPALLALPPHGAGRLVIGQYSHLVVPRPTDPRELRDVDHPWDLEPPPGF